MSIFGKIKGIFTNARTKDRFEMITQNGSGYFSFGGVLYHSDIILSAIRPGARAVGKLLATHVYRHDAKIEKNPKPYIKMLLNEPNPFMSGQVLQEKVFSQLMLNNNAFILIIRDEFGVPCELYPIPCTSAQKVYLKSGELALKFYYTNGKSGTFPYSDIIHLRNDFVDDDIFGESPAKALTEIMDVITTSDQSIIKAIKNSSAINWLIHYTSTLREEDVKKNVKNFVDNYLNIESGSFGAAGISGDAEIQRVEPKDYVPNALQQQNAIKRVYNFFNTNEKIVNSTYSENEWNSYFESVIEPFALQMSNEYTRKLFSRHERAFGNEIYFEASNLSCATLQTKLSLLQMVDRGALTPNEWRATMNLSPVDGGDQPIRRLDTAPTEPMTKGGEE